MNNGLPHSLALLKPIHYPSVAALLAALALTAFVLVQYVTPASTATLTVNSTGDGSDVAPGNGICETATPGECTLRAAIEEANALGGTDVISFSISPAGPQT